MACAPCDSGTCSAADPSKLTPVPNDQWEKKNKTYADPPAPGDTETGSGGTGQRTGTETDETDSARQKQLQEDEADAFQPVNKGTESDTGAADGESATKSRNPASSKGSKKGPSTPKIDEKDGQGTGKVPTINIDEKVAWRSPPTRTRIENRQHVAGTRLVRLPAYPKSDWLPVEAESQVARRK
jgi:hypothetical protein